jgi:alkylhydroperoxidase/carboxymuconolactone decarboxylase family protein YurZ
LRLFLEIVNHFCAHEKKGKNWANSFLVRRNEVTLFPLMINVTDYYPIPSQHGMPKKKEDHMSKSATGSETRPASSSYKEANPQLYAFLDWMAQQDPEYSQAFQKYTAIATGEGQALPVKYREMVMTAILVFMGRREGAEAHLKRAIEHGATKRELFEAGQAAGVPGGGITVGLWMQILTQFDREGAFKNG